ncbi:hypothetical protein [Streptomyces sp. NPDC005438]|uniref:hypothetical protein n=1 Tax=Streptomyces sp. NPDC005438 TaxID=3156880 RepID=UPI0033A24A68
MSARTRAAIARIEREAKAVDSLDPGTTHAALQTYRRFLAGPGRYRYTPLSDCSCPDCELEDVAVARDRIQQVLERLPRRPRRELAALVAPLDRQLERRTLPDPFAHLHPYRSRRPWWGRRLTGP